MVTPCNVPPVALSGTWCPRNGGGNTADKGGRYKGKSSGGPGVLYAQMHEGLDDMPGMPMHMWFSQAEASASHPPPHIEEVLLE
eukprot:4558456-Prorocentrum_lima.AAC.1